MINNEVHLAANVRNLLEYAHHDTAELEDIVVKQLNKHYVPNHTYITVDIPHGKSFLITIEEI